MKANNKPVPNNIIGLRVNVMSGDGTATIIGQGTIIDKVTVYFFWLPDGNILSYSNPEEKPHQKLISNLTELGAVLVEEYNNSKILMDGENETIKYGCQVWWMPIEE